MVKSKRIKEQTIAYKTQVLWKGKPFLLH